MSSVIELEDPLSAVRHRAPALVGTEVDLGLLTDLTGFSVKLVWILGHGLLAREFGDSGITPHRFSMLEVIGRNPGLQQTQLAAALALTRPATSLAVDFWEERGCVERRKIAGDRQAGRRAVDFWEERGCVERRKIAGDRRSFGVCPTPHGEQELERLRGLVRKADAALTAGLSDAESRELRRLLRKIHR